MRQSSNQPRYTGPLKAAILDWAGTMVDFGSLAPVAAFMEVFRRNGVEITQQQAREPMGKHKRDHISEIGAMEPVAVLWHKAHGRAFSDRDVDALFEQFVPLQVATIGEHSALVPGAIEAVAEFRRRGMKVGATTGYTVEMMAVLEPEAAKRGYAPDSSVCASDVTAGRPAPWMCLLNATRLGVYPMEAYVKIGDTVPDIEEGLNAGMWTVGVAATGNEVGSSEADLAALPDDERRRRIEHACERLLGAGAHYVVAGIGDTPAVLDAINERLNRGERP